MDFLALFLRTQSARAAVVNTERLVGWGGCRRLWWAASGKHDGEDWDCALAAAVLYGACQQPELLFPDAVTRLRMGNRS